MIPVPQRLPQPKHSPASGRCLEHNKAERGGISTKKLVIAIESLARLSLPFACLSAHNAITEEPQ